MDTISIVFWLMSVVAFTVYSGWLYRHGEKDRLLITLGLDKNRAAVRVVKAVGLILASAFTWMFCLIALMFLTRKSFFGHYVQYRLGATVLTFALIYFFLLKRRPEQVVPIMNTQDQP
jgi:hypothetical protein